jgi:hypothetical protein
MSELLKVSGIEIRINRWWMGSERPQDFCTPDWTKVLDYYPIWVERMKADGQEPWALQPYMLGFAKALEKSKARKGRTADDWMRRYFEHFGAFHLEHYVKSYADIIPEKKAG